MTGAGASKGTRHPLRQRVLELYGNSWIGASMAQQGLRSLRRGLGAISSNSWMGAPTAQQCQFLRHGRVGVVPNSWIGTVKLTMGGKMKDIANMLIFKA